MAFTFAEAFKSRRGNSGRNPTVDLIYDAYGSDDDVVLKSETLAHAPATYDGLAQLDVYVEPLGPEHWQATVSYGLNNTTGTSVYLREPGDSLESFDTTGSTVHITQSLETVHAAGIGAAAVSDFDGAIGVTDDGVEGLDIEDVGETFQVTKIFTDAQMTPAFRETLRGMSKRYNDATFNGMDAGEVFFHGAVGDRRGDGNWNVQFRFSWKENKTSIGVGSGITIAEKKGWDYLWVRYAPDADATAHAMIRKPIEAFVERVYDEGDFSTLNTGL